MRIALYQPDIPQNLGAVMRLCACLGVALEVIEPCGFPLGDRRLRRVALDYGGLVAVERHASWDRFVAARPGPGGGRLVLLTTRGAQGYADFDYHPDDVLLFGRESAGVPAAVHATADARLRIPMVGAARSLNLASAAAMVLGEALRQTGGLPIGEKEGDEA